MDRLRVRGTLLLVTALAAATVAVPSATAATKPYTLSVCSFNANGCSGAPATVSGGQILKLTATYTNLNGTQQLGSSNLTPPPGFTVASASVPTPGTAAVVGNVIQLRGLSLQPNTSVNVTLSVTIPCTPGTFNWSAQTKQANDFNGPPGNDLTLSGPPPSTTVSDCAPVKLAFVQQPADALTGKPITGSPFDSTSSKLVSVEVEDANSNRVTTSSAPITMTLGPSSGVGLLHPPTTIVNAVNGVATFTSLSIDAPGGYRLSASSEGLQGATSTLFNIQDTAVPCIEDKTCTTGDVPKNLVSTNTTATPVVGQPDAGFLTVSYDVGPTIECQGYTEFSPDQAEIQGPNRPKVVAFRVDKPLMNAQPNNGASFLDMCFGAPYSFATKPGTPPAVETPAGSGFFVGRLPDCGAAPCVSGRNKNQSGDGIITVNVPARTEDPAFRP